MGVTQYRVVPNGDAKIYYVNSHVFKFDKSFPFEADQRGYYREYVNWVSSFDSLEAALRFAKMMNEKESESNE
jgi:hypothetical protein